MFFSYQRRLIFILYLIAASRSQTAVLGSQSFISLSELGREFFPTDEQAVFILKKNTNSITTCAQICLSVTGCRTLNFDTGTKLCRLYEGDIDATGSIIASRSVQSLVGSIKLTAEDFSNQGRPCSFCEDNRYLTCVNSTCQCQSHTFFNGTICQSQKLTGAGCTNDIHCRNDINLTCLPNM